MQHDQKDGADATETATGIGSTGQGVSVKGQGGATDVPGDDAQDDADLVTGGDVDGASNVAGSAAGSGSTDDASIAGNGDGTV